MDLWTDETSPKSPSSLFSRDEVEEKTPVDDHGRQGRNKLRRRSTGMLESLPENGGRSYEGPEEPKSPTGLDWQKLETYDLDPDNLEAFSDIDSQRLLAILQSYVSYQLFHALLYDPATKLGRKPCMESYLGAVMVADITGFTTLTERALTSRRGTELVEELLVAMNNYFGEACDIVLMFGGDIIKYAGDAIIVCFPQSKIVKETEYALALRAASCAYELITNLGVYTPKLGGYGDTVITSDGSKDDIREVPRKLSRPTSLNVKEEDDTQRLSVLVVGHDFTSREVLRQMLLRLNCKVAEAESGKLAIAANSNEQFDAIFMDVLMPRMDGCFATQIIRKSGKPETPVIGVCTETDNELEKRCQDAGMNQLLVKPLVMSQLVGVLRGLKSSGSEDVSFDVKPTDGSVEAEKLISGVYTEHGRQTSLSNDAHLDDQVKDKPQNAATQASQAVDAPVILTMKILVGMGQVAMLSVGGGLQSPSGKPRWGVLYGRCSLASAEVSSEAHGTDMPLRKCCHSRPLFLSGKVILSEEVWAHCQTFCEANILANGCAQLVHVKTHGFTRPGPESPYDGARIPLAIIILKRYLPEMLTVKLEDVSSELAVARPEVRRVTCLFIGFPSLSAAKCTNDDILHNIQTIMLTVQQSLRLFDGLFLQFKMDEKGYVMFCAFGLRGNMHEDDPKRGVLTALDVHRKMVSLGHLVNVGVTTGKLLCSTIGSKRRREYTAFGNCVNLSARLMQAAKNEVLVDLETHQLTDYAFEVEALPPMKLKGRTGLIEVYRIMKCKSSIWELKAISEHSSGKQGYLMTKTVDQNIDTQLCGRVMEMQMVLNKVIAFIARYSQVKFSQSEKNLEEKHQGTNNVTNSSASSSAAKSVLSAGKEIRCTAIIVSGQAGIGKTKLLQAVNEHVGQLSVDRIVVGNVNNNNMLVYGMWVKIVQDILPVHLVASPEERGDIVLKYLHEDLREKAYILNDVLKINLRVSSATGNTQERKPKMHDLRRTMSVGNFLLMRSKETTIFNPGVLKGVQFSKNQFKRQHRKSESIPSSVRFPVDGNSDFTYDQLQNTQGDSGGIMKDTKATVQSLSKGKIRTINEHDAGQVVHNKGKAKTLTSNESETKFNPGKIVLSTHEEQKVSQTLASGTENLLLDLQSRDSDNIRSFRGRRRSSTEEHLSKTSFPEVKIQWLGKLLLDLILTAAKKPLVIFVDDAQLMDNPSWSLLKMLSEQENSGIMVIAACRYWGSHAPKDYIKLMELKSTLQLHLRELDAESTEALVRQKMMGSLDGTVSIPREVFQAISRRTQGHPLFAEQMVMAIVELTRKSVDSTHEENKVLQTLNLDTFKFSHTMEALITSRVDLLEPNQALALKVASVIGFNFSINILQPILIQQLQRENSDILCINKLYLTSLLQELEKLQFIIHQPDDIQDVYSFSNSVSRDVIYEMLPFKQRRTIHADVAKELLKLGSSGARCVTIAEHYTMACKDVEEIEIDLTAIAIDYWQEAAMNAMFKLGEYKQAAIYYQNAIDLGRIVHLHIHPHRMAKWHFGIGKAQEALGDITSCFQNTTIALNYMGEHCSEFTIQEKRSSRCSGSNIVPGFSFWRKQCQIRMHGIIASLTGKLADKEALFFRCEALALLADILIFREDGSSARRVTKRYRAVASEIIGLKPMELARAHVLSAIVANSLSFAKYNYHRSLDILKVQARNHRPDVESGDIQLNLGKIYQGKGKWEKAEKHILEAQRIYEASQGRRELDLCRCLLGLGHYYQGNVEVALELGNKATELDHPELLFWSTYLVVACLNSLNRHKESLQVLTRLQERTYPVNARSLQLKALGWTPAMHLGDIYVTAQEAMTYVPRLLDIVPLSPAFPLAYASAAEVLLISLENHEMVHYEWTVKEKLVERLVKFFKAASTRIGICYTYYKFYKARLTLVGGNNTQAVSLFEEAMREALKLRMVSFATIAGDWFEMCARNPDMHPGFIYSRLQANFANKPSSKHNQPPIPEL